MKAAFLDGGFGTMVQAAGLPPGKDPTDWNIENPDAVTAVHRAYVEAGSQIVLANTFGANRLKYHGEHDLGELIRAALANACASGAEKVALDIGPTGKLLKPAGDLEFAAAYDAFAEVIRLATSNQQSTTNNPQPSLVFIETMGDVYELKAAVLAAKENCDLPIYATVALGEDGKLLTGGSVECVAALLESLGVDAYGFNCGLGPDRMLPFVERLAKIATKPIIVKPNAGMPRIEKGGGTVFDVGPDEFAGHVEKLIEAGASIVGGCCGTTPAYISRVVGRAPRCPPHSVLNANLHCDANALAKERAAQPTIVSSGTVAVELHPHEGLIIGERINPTGKKLLKEAYAKGDTAYVLRETVKQVDAGAKILDVNCGVPGLDEAALLVSTVKNVQSVAACPIQIDTADPVALERALREVNGKALVNSVNGKRASMDAVFPLVKKYGGAIVALCLDETGIPATAEGRLAIARRILAEGAKYGFAERDFVFDALTLSVSAEPNAALVTLETVKRLTEELHVNTVLGVSNVSFGLPNRPALNNAMYALAKKAGLSAAIANPERIGERGEKGERAAAEDVLLGRDRNCAHWIALQASQMSQSSRMSHVPAASLASAIIHGLKEDAAKVAKAELASGAPVMDVIEKGIIPALEEVGRGFEKGSVYLPQLLMAADAAGEAFAVVRQTLATNPSHLKPQTSNIKPQTSNLSPQTSNLKHQTSNIKPQTSHPSLSPIVLATVKGDIHDIGKNIVRSLLENYGFDVIDLGRDVPPGKIVETVKKTGAKLVGLSALMTTTVGAMAETIRQLKAAELDCRTVVGGAVVTQDYADSIGADFYAKDAMRTVRIAEEIMRT